LRWILWQKQEKTLQHSTAVRWSRWSVASPMKP
jgi:hypothetical protein